MEGKSVDTLETGPIQASNMDLLDYYSGLFMYGMIRNPKDNRKLEEMAPRAVAGAQVLLDEIGKSM